MFLALLRTHFNPRYARAKMVLSRAKNIFMPANVNSIVIFYEETTYSSSTSATSEGDIFIYSCCAQSISFEIESTSKEINCAEHEYMNMSPSLIALAPLLTTYNEAINLLKSLYVRTPTKIFARHKLATRKQHPGILWTNTWKN